MFYLFFNFFSSTSADLISPFEVDSKGKIGFWELGGSALPYEKYITLSPPIQFSKGCVWTNVQIPSNNNWTIDLNFHIHQTTGGGFGLFFVEKYGMDGNLYGGPNIFKGIALLGSIIQNNDQSFSIALHFLQSKGGSKFNTNNLPKPDYILDFSRRNIISLQLIRSKNGFLVYGSSKENPKKLNYLFNKNINIDISKNYIGLTAQSDRLINRFDLYSIKFLVNDDIIKNNRPQSMGNSIPSSHYTPETFYRLRNPSFNLTILELLQQESTGGLINGNSSVFDLLTIIDEINNASYDVASYSELNSFIRNNILNYSQKWQQRTLKLIERVQKARNVAGAAFNYTFEIMEVFNSTMKQNLLRTSMKIIDLAELLLDVSENGVDENNELTEMVDDVNKSNLIKILLYGAIIELIGLILLILFLNVPYINQKFLGSIY